MASMIGNSLSTFNMGLPAAFEVLAQQHGGPVHGEEEEQQPAQKKKAGDTKKLTDEEKRKNFLERNRHDNLSQIL